MCVTDPLPAKPDNKTKSRGKNKKIIPLFSFEKKGKDYLREEL